MSLSSPDPANVLQQSLLLGDMPLIDFPAREKLTDYDILVKQRIWKTRQ